MERMKNAPTVEPSLIERAANVVLPYIEGTTASTYGVHRSIAADVIEAIQQAERDRIEALKAEFVEARKRDRERYHPKDPKKYGSSIGIEGPDGNYYCVGCWDCCGSFREWAGVKLHDHVLNHSATDATGGPDA